MVATSAARIRLITILLTYVALGGACAISRPSAATRPAASVSRAVLDAFAARTMTDDAGDVVLRYRILERKAARGERLYPLVIFLHGAGERGDDNVKQLVHGAADFLRVRDRHPAFVVFPQCPAGTYWDGPNRVRNEPTPPGVVPPMPAVLELIDRLIRERPIDPQRVYITGLSMGGFGTFAMVNARPGMFAAAVPVCGGGDPPTAERLAGTPFWIFHGGRDDIVTPERSREMFDALLNAGGTVGYTEYPGVNHNSWTPTYADDKVIDWLFAQRRAPAPATPAP